MMSMPKAIKNFDAGGLSAHIALNRIRCIFAAKVHLKIGFLRKFR